MLYCIDSSILIEYAKVYPADLFPGPWKDLDKLVKQKRVCAPEQTVKELEDGGVDFAATWAKQHKKAIVAQVTADLMAATKEVTNAFPNADWIDATKDVADPWIIGVARVHIAAGTKCTVLTKERMKGNKKKIPFVCAHYKVPFLDHFDLMRAEGWKY